MTNVPRDKKISQFLSQSSIPADAQLVYISGGVNYRINLADLVSSLGVTGTIEQIGDVLGVPILYINGAVNSIRNIEPGSGIYATVSPENGLTLKHNFTEDTTGVKLVKDLTADQPVFRSLVAGSGVNVSASNGVIQIALTSTPATTRTIIVNSISDFPAAVSGVITLENNTEYAIRNSISTANRFVFGSNTVITGPNKRVVTLTYTGTGIMFTANNVNCGIYDISISATSGTFLDFNGSGVEAFEIDGCSVSANVLGNIDNIDALHFYDVEFSTITNGFVFGGVNGYSLFEAGLTTISAGILYDLGTSTFKAFSIVSGRYTLNGTSKFLKGAASSANIISGSLGTVVNSRFLGTGTVLDTITVNDIRWRFVANDSINDSSVGGMVTMVNNATNTVIAVAGTPVLVAGTWVSEKTDKFEVSAAGRLTYRGDRPISVDVNFALSLEPASGSNKVINLYVYKNGAQVPSTKSSSIISSGARRRVPVVWATTMNKDDYLECWVANATDTISVLVVDAVLRASQ